MDVEKDAIGQQDSSSGHSPSEEDVKMGVQPGGHGPGDTVRLPPDPDNGLSEEERKRIVSLGPNRRPCQGSTDICSRIAAYSSSLTSA